MKKLKPHDFDCSRYLVFKDGQAHCICNKKYKGERKAIMMHAKLTAGFGK